MSRDFQPGTLIITVKQFRKPYAFRKGIELQSSIIAFRKVNDNADGLSIVNDVADKVSS